MNANSFEKSFVGVVGNNLNYGGNEEMNFYSETKKTAQNKQNFNFKKNFFNVRDDYNNGIGKNNENLKEIAAEVKRQDIRIVADRYLTKSSKSGYDCPSNTCSNGTGKDGTGAAIYWNQHNNRYELHCPVCGRNWNTLELIETCEHLDINKDFAEVVKRGCEIFGLSFEFKNFQRSNSAPKNEETFEEFKRLAESRNNLSALGEYFRGLPIDILQRLKWGFLQDFSHPNNPKKKFPAVIIPNVKGGILARSIDKDVKPSNIAPSAPTIINLPEGTDFTLTLVEGAIDAASFAYATDFNYAVIATGGTTGKNSTLDFLKNKYPSDKPAINLMFDNDTPKAGKEYGAGEKAAKELQQLLTDAGFLVVTNFIDAKKDYDFNAILQAEGKDALQTRIDTIINNAQIKLDEMKEFQEKVSDWQAVNGKISKEKLQELKLSAEKINGLTNENVSAETFQNSKTLYQVAQCRFYDFYSATANRFQELLRSSAQNFSLSQTNINKKIDDFVRQVKQEHKDALKKFDAEKKKQEREERIKQSLQAEEVLKQTLKDLQEKLKSAAPVDIADLKEKIIETIRQLCDWNFDKIGKPVSIKATNKNLMLIFENDPNILNLVARNSLFQQDVFLKCPIWRKEIKSNELWTDSDDAELRFYLREK